MCAPVQPLLFRYTIKTGDRVKRVASLSPLALVLLQHGNADSRRLKKPLSRLEHACVTHAVSMTKMKTKSKSKVAVKESEDSAPKFKKNDRKEIQEFIKQLGLESFTHDTLDQEGNEVVKPKLKKTTKKSAEVPDDFDDDHAEDFPPRKPNIAKKDKKADFKKGSNNRDSTESSASHVKGKKNANLVKPDHNQSAPKGKMLRPNPMAQKNSFSGDQSKFRTPAAKSIPIQNALPNKKKVFDDTGAAIPVSTTGMGIDTETRQNKRIVFDESYLVNENTSGKKSSDQSTPWYQLLITPDIPWYQQGVDLKASTQYVTGPELKKLEEEGMEHLETDVQSFKKVREIGSEKSENRWLHAVLRSGAFTDKIAAHTLLLQESPVHNLASLRFLISLVNVKGRRECMASLDALMQLIAGGKILNPSAKLVPFSKKPIGSLYGLAPRDKQKTLALWSYENQLKELYNQMILSLDGLLKDAVDTTRRKAIGALATLLAYSPEQEQDLLSRLVNKVGDPTRAVATTTVGQLERLLQQHGNMKLVVVSEMERLLYRPNINTKAQYYGICFLSQILLDAEDLQLANKLIIIYVSFFKACVKKGEVDSKLMSALLTGVKRAFPFTQSGLSGNNPLDSHVDTLFKLVHIVRFGLAIQVLCILDQVVGNGRGNADRFYSVLFRKLMDPDLAHSTKLSMFFNLLFTSLKRDDSVDRQRAFVKRILQVALTCPPPLSCGFLYLVSELFKVKPEIKIFRSESNPFANDDDDDEHFKDADDDVVPAVKETESTEDPSKESETTDEAKEKSVSSTWIHRDHAQNQQSIRKGYDALARNPLYGRADLSGGFWELHVLSVHNHPSVSLFAKTIMEGMPIEYNGDPLQDFTLIRFLDRFVFRNPKQIPTTKMAPPAQRKVLGKRRAYKPTGVRAMAVDSKEFINQPSTAIPPEEMFLYTYFKRRASTRGRTEDDDVESVASEDFEQYLAESADVDFAADIKPKSKDKSKKKSDRSASDAEEGEEDEESDLEAAEVDSEDEFEEDDEFQDAFKDFDDMLNEDTTVVEDGDRDEASGDDEEQIGFREEDAEFSDEEAFEAEDDAGEAPSTSKAGKVKAKSKSKKRAMEDDDELDDLDLAFDDSPSIKKKKNRHLFSDTGMDFAAAEEFAALLEDNATPGLDIGGTSEALANKDRASVKQLQWEMARDRWMKDLNRPRRGGKSKGQDKGRTGGRGKFKSSAQRRPAGSKRGGKR